MNAKTSKGLTPLDVAAESGYKDFAELLIAKGADVNVKDDTGGTPLHYAAYLGYKGITEYSWPITQTSTLRTMTAGRRYMRRLSRTRRPSKHYSANMGQKSDKPSTPKTQNVNT